MKNTGIKIAEIKRELKVRFWAPGLLFSESWDEPVKTTDPLEIEWPEDAYAFEFFEETTITTDDGVVCKGTRDVDGKRYYHPDSLLKTLEEIPDTPENPILRYNMISNEWNAVITTRSEDWFVLFDPERDVILPKKEHDEENED